MVMKSKLYEGIEEDLKDGMTMTGNIVRDAWVFGIIEETETCKGWNRQGIEGLYNQVSDAWEPYGHMVSSLPDDLREKHKRIYDEAIKQARANGWDPDASLVDEI